jgi:hypothetical protein
MLIRERADKLLLSLLYGRVQREREKESERKFISIVRRNCPKRPKKERKKESLSA